MKGAWLAAAFSFLLNAACAAPMPPPEKHMLTVNGHRLAFTVVPGKLPVVVLDAGAGLSSSYWGSILPALYDRTGSEIIAYDRAGFGDSDMVKPPYNVLDSVSDLAGGLQLLGATHDLILVPHSFAGVIATYFTILHPGWVAASVMVDANVPEFFTDAENKHLQAVMSQRLATLSQKPDGESQAMAAIISALPAIDWGFHRIQFPSTVPCTVIVSGKTPFTDPADQAAWKQAHADFAHAAPNRPLIVAEGSAHDMVLDRPLIIVDAVSAMVDRVRAQK